MKAIGVGSLFLAMMMLVAVGLGLGDLVVAAQDDSQSAAKERPVKESAGAGKKPRLADLKFNLPKGWEAKHRDGSNTWKVSKDAPPDYPDVYVGWLFPRDDATDLDAFVKRAQKGPDHFAFGWHWASVTEKGKLPDGFYLVGRIKLTTDKEAKKTGFAIVRDLGGEAVIFECFDAADPAQRKEAMDLCKAAKF